jgi:hypothetical protein
MTTASGLFWVPVVIRDLLPFFSVPRTSSPSTDTVQNLLRFIWAEQDRHTVYGSGAPAGDPIAVEFVRLPVEERGEDASGFAVYRPARP